MKMKSQALSTPLFSHQHPCSTRAPQNYVFVIDHDEKILLSPMTRIIRRKANCAIPVRFELSRGVSIELIQTHWMYKQNPIILISIHRKNTNIIILPKTSAALTLAENQASSPNWPFLSLVVLQSSLGKPDTTDNMDGSFFLCTASEAELFVE